MGWFSKKDEGFLLSTVVPGGDGANCEVPGETNGMMMVAVSGTAVKMG